MTPPAAVLTTAEAKAFLKVDHSAEDALIDSMVLAATAYIDGPTGIGVAVMQQTWDLFFDAFPISFSIPLGPISAISWIKYYDVDNTQQTLSSAAYDVDIASSPCRISPSYNNSFPSTRLKLNAVNVRFVAGATASGNVPPDILNTIKMILGHLYRNREAVSDGRAGEVELGVQDLINRHMVGRFA